jgi:Pili and flagellar-assembly chaperone, PapD N-terminal domain
MKRVIRFLLTSAALAVGLASALNAQASVVIAGARVIYNASDSEPTIMLTSESKAPALMQIWLLAVPRSTQGTLRFSTWTRADGKPAPFGAEVSNERGEKVGDVARQD